MGTLFRKEQIFLVTGASSGIGKAVALQLNREGATVIAIARNEQRLIELQQQCDFPDNLHIEIKDLAENIDGLSSYVHDLKEKYGKLAGMAYCAGITGLMPARSMTYQFAKKVFDINYFAPLVMTKGILDKRNNIGRGTSLVFLSSIDALARGKGQCVYSGSKSALSTSMTAIAKEYATMGYRVNTVLPSMINTPMTEQVVAEGFGDDDKYPMGYGEPDDVANMVVYLLSEKAKFISGQNYVIDSGLVV